MGLDDFRREARAWIHANLERQPRSDTRRGRAEDKAPDEIAASRALQQKLFDAGFAGISYPKAYGGRGLTFEHERVWNEEAADFATPDFGGLGFVMFDAIGRSMLAHAGERFLERHIPKMLAGQELWCQFYSEPEAGSDLAGIRTRATRDGERWVLRGSKVWSTGAHHADYGMCLARTDWDVPKHRGLTWFAVATAAPGVTVRPLVQIDGTTGFCEEFLDDVVVADDDVIGEVNDGWSVAQTMLVYERRSGESVVHDAEPRSLASDLVALARQVRRLDDPVVRQLIARAHINDYAQFHLRRRVTARLRASSSPQPAIAAYSKLAAGVFNPLRARIALDIAGAEALLWAADDHDGARVSIDFLNARQSAIAAGTNEMQRNGIGERVLGLPREPSFDSNRPFSEVLRDAQTWTGKVG